MRESALRSVDAVLPRVSGLFVLDPIDALETLALSVDLLEPNTLTRFIGVETLVALSTDEGSGTVLVIEACIDLGDVMTESVGLDASTALFLCQNIAGEVGRMLLGVAAPS